MSAKVVIPILITFLAPFAIYLFRKNPDNREGVSFVAAIATLLSVLAMAPEVLSGKILKCTLFTIMPGITVSFAADGLAMVFAVVSSFLWILTTSYNIGYMRGLKEHAQTRYYVCFAVADPRGSGRCLCGEPFHPLSFLRNHHHLHLSAGRPSSGRGSL